MGEQWRNRIVGYGEEVPDQLLANPSNWRTHPKQQQDTLAGVLDEVGWVDDVIVNRTTGYVVDGHLRVAMAISKGMATVPVKYVELSESEEAKILATLDPIAAMAAADADILGELLQQVETENEAVQRLLDEEALRTGVVEFDPEAEWTGMPEFEQEDLTATRTISVHFATQEDVCAFARLVGQTITDKTKSLWYPKAEIRRFADKRYISES